MRLIYLKNNNFIYNHEHEGYNLSKKGMRPPGFEPGSQAWQACVLATTLQPLMCCITDNI